MDKNLLRNKNSPQFRILEVLATNTMDAILQSTSTNSHYNYYYTQILQSKKNSPSCELLPIFGADWLLWVAFLVLDWSLAIWAWKGGTNH